MPRVLQQLKRCQLFRVGILFKQHTSRSARQTEPAWQPQSLCHFLATHPLTCGNVHWRRTWGMKIGRPIVFDHVGVSIGALSSKKMVALLLITVPNGRPVFGLMPKKT